jgi:hypothetical protein
MVFETLGALNSEGEDVLHSLFRFAAKQLGREFTSYCGRAWARMSCCLQRSVSQAILTRIDGRELPRVEPSGPDNFVTIPEPAAEQPSLPVLDSSFPITSSVPLPAPSPAPLPVPSIPAAAIASVSPPSPPPAALAFAALAVGGVVPVRADGDCCYHLCAVFGELMVGQDPLRGGSTSYSVAATTAARGRIMSNITEYIDFVKSTCVDPSEVDGAILQNFGELPSSYVPRVTGTAKEEHRLGLINDFAAYTAKTPFQVMVIDAGSIWADSSVDELHKAVRTAEFKTDTEFVKSRVLCAVMHSKHYDLCVVRSASSVQAVFAAGVEWEAAVELILAFIKSKAPSRGQQVREELCPRWAPPPPAPVPAQTPHTRARESKRKQSLPTYTRAREKASVSEKEDTSPAPSSLSSLPSVSVSSVSVSSPVVVGRKKYITRSAGVPKHHSSTHQTGV